MTVEQLYKAIAHLIENNSTIKDREVYLDTGDTALMSPLDDYIVKYFRHEEKWYPEILILKTKILNTND